MRTPATSWPALSEYSRIHALAHSFGRKPRYPALTKISPRWTSNPARPSAENPGTGAVSESLYMAAVALALS